MIDLKENNILIAGVGGQGNLLISRIIGAAAIKAGLNVRIAEMLGIGQRGGAVVSHIKMGREIFGGLISDGGGNVLLGLEPVEALRVAARYISKDGLVIMNTRPIMPISVNMGLEKYPETTQIIEQLKRVSRQVIAFDAIEIAKKAGNAIMMNIVMLGALTSSEGFPIRFQIMKDTIEENVPSGTEEKNLRAFELGKKAFTAIIETC